MCHLVGKYAMRISEITSNVIGFPRRGPSASTIDVPAGYDSFYTKEAGPTSAHIMGIRPDGRHVQVSTTSRELAGILAKAYNQGGRSDVAIKPVSLTQAFGSGVVRAFDDMGVRFSEKPDSWDTVKQEASCSAAQLARVDSEVGGIPEVSPEEVFAGSTKSPLGTITANAPGAVVMTMPNGDRFLADRGGGTKYYRMWLHVRPHGITLAR